MNSRALTNGFKVKENIIDLKSGEIILKAGEEIENHHAEKLKMMTNYSKVEIESENLLGFILVGEIINPDPVEPKFNYNQRITKRTLEIIKEKKLQEIKILRIKKLYFNGDMHFNDRGLKFLGKSIGNWVINNPSETIGFDDSAY